MLERLLGTDERLAEPPRSQEQPPGFDTRVHVGGVESDRVRVRAERFLELALRRVDVGQLAMGLSLPRVLLNRIAILNRRCIVPAGGELLIAALDERLRGLAGAGTGAGHDDQRRDDEKDSR